MNDYCYGIAYATGYIAKEKEAQFLVVRNSDPWCVKCISNATGYEMYKSGYHEKNGMTTQWIVKARNIYDLRPLCEIQSLSDFCRAYIEIHGILDISKRKGNKKGLRFRIYGSEEIITFINDALPAAHKKIQYIRNNYNGYVGKTCAIYFQSSKEIEDILRFLDGTPKNIGVWDKWEHKMNMV